LRLSIVKPLAAEWLFQTYSDIRADKKLIYKGFEKAGIAECVGFLRFENITAEQNCLFFRSNK
jgi:hypothetical protein